MILCQYRKNKKKEKRRKNKKKTKRRKKKLVEGKKS